jgi:small subunit ribosomal protein S6
MTRPPRTYELMTILAPDVAEDQLGPAVDQIKDYVTGAGGTISEVLQDSPWGRRRLAYPIRHNGHDVRDGYYTVLHFDLEPERVADIEREILLNPQIIRYLVSVYTAPAPSPEGPEGEQAGEESGAAAAPAAETEQAPTEQAEETAEAPAAASEAPPAEAETDAESAASANEAPEASVAPADEEEVTAPADTTDAETDNEQTGAAE